MAISIRRTQYFYAVVDDRPGSGLKVLKALQSKGVNLLAFTAFPVADKQAQFDFFPESAEKLHKACIDTGITLRGPKNAFIVQGDDEPGALVDIHEKLASAGISAYAANGTTDGASHFGYVLWVKSSDFEKAASVLGI